MKQPKYDYAPGHLTKITAMPMFSKNNSKFFSGVNDFGSWYVTLGMWSIQCLDLVKPYSNET